jgi:O-antigen ligase
MKIAPRSIKGPALLGLFLACMPLTASAHGGTVIGMFLGMIFGTFWGVVLGIVLLKWRRPSRRLLTFTVSVIGSAALGIAWALYEMKSKEREIHDAYYQDQIKRQTRDAGKQ